MSIVSGPTGRAADVGLVINSSNANSPFARLLPYERPLGKIAVSRLAKGCGGASDAPNLLSLVGGNGPVCVREGELAAVLSTIAAIARLAGMLQHFSVKRGKLMRTANILIALALAASPAQGQSVPDLPANPLKAIDGEWYGVDHKIKLSVANGVVTIVENDTADPYLKKIAAPAEPSSLASRAWNRPDPSRRGSSANASN